MNSENQIELDGALLYYMPNWIEPEAANFLFSNLVKSLPWQQPLIQIAGRKVRIPRKQVWMGDKNSVMRYSGITFYPVPWSEDVAAMRDLLSRDVGQCFNSVLLNLYRDGNDSVSWHADDEKELGCNPVIASVSLGATRKFSMKTKSGKGNPLHLQLNSGDLFVMAGETQKHWFHALPKDKSLVGSNCERINLTFRFIQGG